MLDLDFFSKVQRNVIKYLMENVSNVGVIGLDQSVGVVLPVRFKRKR